MTYYKNQTHFKLTMPHLMATMKNVKADTALLQYDSSKEDTMHLSNTFPRDSEGKRKRKLHIKDTSVDCTCGAHTIKRIKKENNLLQIKQEHDVPSMDAPSAISLVKSEGLLWRCDVACGSAVTTIEDKSFVERDCFQQCNETWVLDTNGDICYSKPSDKVQIADIIIDSFHPPSPLGSCGYPSPTNLDSDTSQLDVSEDNDDELNLSWLLNFNVESLFVSDGFKLPALRQEHTNQNHRAHTSKPETGASRKGLAPSQSSANEVDPKEALLADVKIISRNQAQTTLNPKNGINGTNTIRKPPFTYSDLIERSLKESGELTVSGIYNWISSHYPYYKANDDRWKNSVRHNLSINPHFRKGRKSPKGAGHLWCIANTCKESYVTMQSSANTANFQDVSITEVQAATASIEEDKENRQLPLEDIYYFDTYCEEGVELGDEVAYITEETITLDDQDLAHTAEQVLKGVKKEVQVQYVVQNQKKYVITESDFMNPITVEVAVEESGLNYQLGSTGICEDGTSFLITEINPITLGINMVEGDPITDTTGILFCDSDGNINSLNI